MSLAFDWNEQQRSLALARQKKQRNWSATIAGNPRG